MVANWSNVTTWEQMLEVANTNTGSWFWTLITYTVFVLTLLLNVGWGFEVGLITAGFIALIISLVLAFAGLVSWTVVLSFVAIIVLTFIYIGYTTKKY